MKWGRIKAVILRHLYVWPRNLEQVTDTFYWPVLELVMWGFLTIFLNSREQGQTPRVTFLLSSIIFWGILNQSQFQINMTFMREAWDRNLLNLFSSPLSPWEFMIGALLLSLIKFSVSISILVILANVFFSFNIFIFGWYLVPFLIILMLFGWAASFIITGVIIRLGFGAQSFAWTIVSLTQPFSAVLYPLATLPLWAQKVGYLFPATYVFEGARQILLTKSMNVENLIIGLSLNMIFLAISMLFFRHMFKVALEKGSLIKFV